jgi:hypothetical protein
VAIGPVFQEVSADFIDVGGNGANGMRLTKEHEHVSGEGAG